MLNGSNKEMKRVLIAPLDWGLGHATRCIPIVRQLQARGLQVFLAGEGAVQSLLQAEFPELPFLHLEGYRVQYGSNATTTMWQLLRQIPQIKAAIRNEKAWLSQMLMRYRFDAVISDNRYGLYHPGTYAVLLTHQLRIQAPTEGAAHLLQWMHYRYIQKFSACWVPDVPGTPSLAGALSHPGSMPRLPVQYIGPISRFIPSSTQQVSSGPLLLLLSGPEPQRSIYID